MSYDNKYEKLSGSLKWFYNFGEHNITDGFHSADHNSGLNFYESFKSFNGSNLSFGLDYTNYGGFAENILAMKGMGVIFADTTI